MAKSAIPIEGGSSYPFIKTVGVLGYSSFFNPFLAIPAIALLRCLLEGSFKLGVSLRNFCTFILQHE